MGDKMGNNKPFERCFNTFLSNGHNLREVFDDFLDLTVCAFGKEEERYMQIIGKYNEEEVNLSYKALSDLIVLMESETTNNYVLGEFYDKHISFGHNGQFFTLMHITDLISQISGMDYVDDGKIKTVLNPCRGSGRMLLSHLKLGRSKSSKFYYYGSDIDRSCCLRSVINLFLNGGRGEVYWMDALKMEVWEGWRFGFQYGLIPFLIKIDLEEAEVKETVGKIMEEQRKYRQERLF